MKIFDADSIISLVINGMNQKKYKLDYVFHSILSPQYLFGHAGHYILERCCLYG
jgi:hypothetical protein